MNRRTVLGLMIAEAIALCAAAPAAFAQDAGTSAPATALTGYYTVKPLHDASGALAASAPATATTIPMWSYTITSPVDGHTYSGTMVGRSPYFHGARTTNVTTVLVPLIVNMPDGGVFNSTASDSKCSPKGTALELVQGSPILVSSDIKMGTTDVGNSQYIDAFQRGAFWSNVSVTGDSYHTTLSPLTTLNAVTINVPFGSGETLSASSTGGCGPIGIMDINWFDSYLENTVIPSLAGQGAVPTALPQFLLYNVVMSEGPPASSGCCILGYHSAYNFPYQTYLVADYDSTGLFKNVEDITALSHEVGEWLDDPLGINPTPAWGHVGQVSGCQNNLEVGDPLSGKLFPSITMPNSMAYHPQELAFFSWFYRQTPSDGVNKWYSDHNTFTSGAGAVCQ